jgi:hypothetical protein
MRNGREATDGPKISFEPLFNLKSFTASLVNITSLQGYPEVGFAGVGRMLLKLCWNATPILPNTPSAVEVRRCTNH